MTDAIVGSPVPRNIRSTLLSLKYGSQETNLSLPQKMIAYYSPSHIKENIIFFSSALFHFVKKPCWFIRNWSSFYARVRISTHYYGFPDKWNTWTVMYSFLNDLSSAFWIGKFAQSYSILSFKRILMFYRSLSSCMYFRRSISLVCVRYNLPDV